MLGFQFLQLLSLVQARNKSKHSKFILYKLTRATSSGMYKYYKIHFPSFFKLLIKYLFSYVICDIQSPSSHQVWTLASGEDIIILFLPLISFLFRSSRVLAPYCLCEAVTQASHQHHFSAPGAKKWKNVSLIKL